MRPSLLPTSAIVLIAFVGTLFFLREDRNTQELLKLRVAELEAENAKLSQSLRAATKEQDLAMPTPETGLSAPVSTHPVAPSSTTGDATQSPDRETNLRFFAGEQIRNIQRYVTVTPEQAQAITDNIRTRELDSDKALQQAIIDAIGEERYKEYQDAERKQDQVDEAETLEDEVLSLVRKLQLNTTQEDDVRNALSQIRTELSPQREKVRQLSREAMLLHRAPGDNSEELRNTYQTLKENLQQLNNETRSRTLEALKNKLSDQQLNALVEYQQQSRDRFLED